MQYLYNKTGEVLPRVQTGIWHHTVPLVSDSWCVFEVMSWKLPCRATAKLLEALSIIGHKLVREVSSTIFIVIIHH